jgi:hypothetical protein
MKFDIPGFLWPPGHTVRAGKNTKFESKESWPKGPGFGLPLKGAVSLKARQVKSA